MRSSAALLLLLAASAQAQPAPDVSAELRTLTAGFGPPGEAATLRTPAIDASGLASASAAATAGGIGPFHFAEPFAVGAAPGDLGEWLPSPDGGTSLWRLRIVSEGALSLNFGFTRYRMPPGGRLFVYTPGFAEVLGPYTEADNESHGQLWTPILSGGEAVIVVSAPADRAGEVELELGSVNRGFRDPVGVTAAKYLSCNVNVACSDADPYRDQVRSVGWYSAGGRNRCSGVLLNNTAGDGKLYFLTADHCLEAIERIGLTEEEAAASVVAYWNDETTTCAGSTARFDPRQSQSGAFHRTRWAEADSWLMELDDRPDSSHNLYLAGWDRRLPDAGPVVNIHHPGLDFKSIATSSDVPLPTSFEGNDRREEHNYLRVRWESGKPTFGSSGSPLFSAGKRVVGQLRGSNDFPSCRVRNQRIWYGRFDKSWSVMSPWLDPLGTGVDAIDGRAWNGKPQAVGSLDDQALKFVSGETQDSLALDVAYGFLDLDGDDLTYAASSSAESVATVSVSGSTLTLTPVAAGTATVTVTATDAGGANESASQELTITVGDNTSPEAVGELAGMALRVPAGAETVDVADTFQDPDGDDLTYAASSSAESVATVSVSGSTVTVTPVSGGLAAVDVTATDAAGSNTMARRRFEVVVNRGPLAVRSLWRMELRVETGAETVDVADTFQDPDGDDLTYAASSSAESVATVGVNGSTVTVTPVSGGRSTVTVTATDVDGSNLSAERRFYARVANRPPVAVGTIAAVARRMRDGPVDRDLASAFSDPDGDDLTYGASSSDSSVARVSVSGSTVTVTPAAPGVATVTATAKDAAGSNTTVRQQFEVVVNRRPVAVAALPALPLRIETGAETVDVSSVFEDPDGDDLTYGASSSAESVATVSTSGSTVTVTPVAAGTTTVTVAATDVDGSNLSAEQTFKATVANRPPVTVGSLPESVLRVGEGTSAVAVSGAFNDPDGDSLTYGATSDDPGVASVQVSGSSVRCDAGVGGQRDGDGDGAGRRGFEYGRGAAVRGAGAAGARRGRGPGFGVGGRGEYVFVRRGAEGGAFGFGDGDAVRAVGYGRVGESVFVDVHVVGLGRVAGGDGVGGGGHGCRVGRAGGDPSLGERGRLRFGVGAVGDGDDRGERRIGAVDGGRVGFGGRR